MRNSFTKDLSVDLFTDEIGIHPLLNLLKELNMKARILVITDKKWDKLSFHHAKISDEFQKILIIRNRIDFDQIEDGCLGLSLGISEKIPLEIIQKYTHGILNFHLGKLPTQKGANTVNWLVIRGETNTEFTLHVMTEQIDSGPILHAVKIEIDFEDTAVDLVKKMCLAVGEFTMPINQFLMGTLVPRTQEIVAKKNFPRRSPEDGEFNWKMTNIEIYNMIRALVDPWPGAYFLDGNGNKIVIKHRLTISEIENLRRKYALE